MLLRVDRENRTATRVTGVPLGKFRLDERGLQDVLFRSLDRLIGEDELLILMPLNPLGCECTMAM
jgi:hypothetical protein